MSRRFGRHSPALLALTAASVLCTSRECPGLGFESGVQVTFDRGMLPHSGNIVFDACVDRDCKSHTWSAKVGNALGVDIASVPSDAEVRVSVKVFGKSGQVFAARTTAHSTKWEPAGPGCGTKWVVRLHAHPESQLTG